jgi:hypothetical protein
MRIVRGAKSEDADAIWRILEPMLRAGETYPLPQNMNKNEALSYWMGADHEVYVAEDDGEIVGTYFMKANQKARGAHVIGAAREAKHALLRELGADETVDYTNVSLGNASMLSRHRRICGLAASMSCPSL